jgi:serine/threonine protein kinase
MRPAISLARNRASVYRANTLDSPIEDARRYIPHTLRHDLQQHARLPIPDCIQIGLSLATALAHLHEQGLVHRDIKPSNIIFVNGVAKLGDIGLVTEAGDTQSIVGTEGYLPPEGPVTPQADLFSLGKVLYEAVTGLDAAKFLGCPRICAPGPMHGRSSISTKSSARLRVPLRTTVEA